MALDKAGIEYAGSKLVSHLTMTIVEEVSSRNGDTADMIVVLSRLNAAMVLLFSRPEARGQAIEGIMQATEKALAHMGPDSADAVTLRAMMGVGES